MCGIIGAVGTPEAVPVVMQGLRRFEKRGYDAAGIGVKGSDGSFVVRRALGRWEKLRAAVDDQGLPPARMAIGHTRWGTHGSRTEVRNAHPHVSADGQVMLVHNGDIANHDELRNELRAKGWRFVSETDSEVIVNLIADLYKQNAATDGGSREMSALTAALARLRGKWALVACFADAPHEALFLASAGGMPLSIGYGEGCMYAASEPEGLYGVTNRFLRLADGQCVQVRADGLHDRTSLEGVPWNQLETIVPRVVETEARPEGVPSTLYEIGEIPARARTFVDAFAQQLRGASGRKLIERLRRPGARLIVTGCGSAYHAALYAKAVLSGVCGFEVHAVLASDEGDLSGFVLDPEWDVLMAVSQSGTTYDTLQMVRAARAAGLMVFALVNHAHVTLDALSDGAFYTDAGLEDGVAATKTVVLQCLAFLVLKAELTDSGELWDGVRDFAGQVGRLLRDEAPVLFVARMLAGYLKQTFVLGKRVMNVVAREGALKLTELAYLSMCVPPQGELKHGPLAAMDARTATVLLAADGEQARDAALLALSEIRNCEHGPIVVLASEATAQAFADGTDCLVTVPDAHPDVLPLLMLVRMLQIAYWTATSLENDVDRPRWLAKTVTV